ncbi:alternative ribosome rescue aminoacyl-tRNA hydrolase ArfB [Seonamhaeicola maritimus]|uniref:alternative ribosome rescue aminoacyl-tRNA hydrolase ArfB n=1 Tax=Seonamhaeicola maritimus TaxID=2591822 RepID=UPI0024959305|nr:alternative ribosome rescue aminoacyl-tRNA hydrolase ArfB [Seonamhaeicola maritimus]
MFNKEFLLKELTFKAVRSSGSGGQHVNKVASKIELLFNLKDSKALSEDQKNLLLLKLQNRLTKEGLLILQCDETRSQHKNKGLVIKRFFDIIRLSLTVQKRRISTKTPNAVIRKRLKNKQIKSEKKANRRKPNID